MTKWDQAVSIFQLWLTKSKTVDFQHRLIFIGMKECTKSSTNYHYQVCLGERRDVSEAEWDFFLRSMNTLPSFSLVHLPLTLHVTPLESG